jgi:methyl-accepting chemotaxis protein
MVTSMTAIKKSSDKVSRIIKTIDQIAFQTKR